MFVTGFGALQNDGGHLKTNSMPSKLVWCYKVFKE
jgi:hypothetical protein